MFLSDNIDWDTPEKYVLSIRIKPDGCAFLVHDPNNAKVFCFHEVGFSHDTSLLNNVRRIILDEDDYSFLTGPFGKTNVVIASADYELMPDTINDKLQLKKFYRLTHDRNNGQALIGGNRLPGYNFVFGMDDELYSLLKRSIYNPIFYHHNGLQIGYFRKKAANLHANSMYVHFHENFVDLNCFDAENNILFAHSYYNEHYLNVVFHILSAWEKLGFNQLEHHLAVSGYYPAPRMEPALKDYIRLIKSDGLFEQLVDFGEKAQNIPLDLLILSA
ncbi:MAG: DUF3822 family protein [Prevotella sp.]|jgi:hypothetical protein|nr:DUF3822 family protein [Prevotella sp.]